MTQPASKRTEIPILIEDPEKNIAPSVADLCRLSKACHDRFKELDEREDKGQIVTREEWTKVEKDLERFTEQMTQLQTKLTIESSRVPAGISDEELGARLSSLMQVPDEEEFRGVNQAYFNLMACRSEELLGAAQISDRYVPGMNKRLHAALAQEGNANFAMKHARFQYLNDAMVIKYKVLSLTTAAKNRISVDPIAMMREFDEWPEFDQLAKEFGRVLSNSTGGGAQLLPTLMSNRIGDMVEVALKVAALFPTMPMTSLTYKSPMLTQDPTFFLVGESTAYNQAEDTSLYSDIAIAQATWTLQKLLAFVIFSSEATEDLITPILSYVEGRLTASAERTIEDTIINGDTTAGTMDGTVFNPGKSNRRAWKGLRYYSLMTASYPAAIDNTATNSGDMALNAIDLQAAMNDYGVNPDDFVWIPGFKAYHRMRKHADYRTMADIGADAATVRGQVGVWEGSPVVLSNKVFLQEADGKYDDGATRTFGSLIGVKPSFFVRAIGPGIDVVSSSEYRFNQDQIVLRARLRQDFEPMATPSATVTPVGIIYNI